MPFSGTKSNQAASGWPLALRVRECPTPSRYGNAREIELWGVQFPESVRQQGDFASTDFQPARARPECRALVQGNLGAQEKVRLRRSFCIRGLIVVDREQSEDEGVPKESKKVRQRRLEFRRTESFVFHACAVLQLHVKVFMGSRAYFKSPAALAGLSSRLPQSLRPEGPIGRGGGTNFLTRRFLSLLLDSSLLFRTSVMALSILNTSTQSCISGRI